MTGIFAPVPIAGKPRCLRCKRPFTPKKEGDKYGPRCAAIMAGQVELDSQALVSGKVLCRKPEPEPFDEADPDLHNPAYWSMDA